MGWAVCGTSMPGCRGVWCLPGSAHQDGLSGCGAAFAGLSRGGDRQTTLHSGAFGHAGEPAFQVGQAICGHTSPVVDGEITRQPIFEWSGLLDRLDWKGPVFFGL